MNPFVSVDVCTPDNLKETILTGKYSAFVYGFKSFQEAMTLNAICREARVPFYLLNSSGLFGFFFIDLGPELTFTYHKKATETEETQTIKDSITIEDYMRQFKSESEGGKAKLEWNKRTVMRNDKYLMLSIAAKFLQETQGMTMSE